MAFLQSFYVDLYTGHADTQRILCPILTFGTLYSLNDLFP
jgi:hypothetical protein